MNGTGSEDSGGRGRCGFRRYGQCEFRRWTSRRTNQAEAKFNPSEKLRRRGCAWLPEGSGGGGGAGWVKHVNPRDGIYSWLRMGLCKEGWVWSNENIPGRAKGLGAALRRTGSRACLA